MFNPDGSPAGNVDRMMLRAMWARHYEQKGQDIIFAGLGHPTNEANLIACKDILQAWKHNGHRALTEANALKELNSADLKDLEPMEKKSHPILTLKKLLSQAFNAGYKQEKYDAVMNNLSIHPEHVIPTIGGAGGLNLIFKVLNKKIPGGYFITPKPFYPLYQGEHHRNRLIPVSVMDNPGYRLLPAQLRQTFMDAKKDNKTVSALLLCNPNNPLGTVINVQEWLAIIDILKNETCYIIIDEAYAELLFDETTPSFMEMLYKQWFLGWMEQGGTAAEFDTLVATYLQFRERVICLRSATKGLSLSGERMAELIVFKPTMIQALNDEGLAIGLPSVSLQHGNAEALNHLLLDSSNTELSALHKHYKKQVQFVVQQLKPLGLQMPDPLYVVEGGFYVLANLKPFLGYQVTDQAVLDELARIGIVLDKGKLTTDNDISYYLLVTEGLMLTPLSDLGGEPFEGILRITCSLGFGILDKLINILAKTLKNMQGDGQKIQMIPSLSSDSRSLCASVSPQTQDELFLGPPYCCISPKYDFAYYMQDYWRVAVSKSTAVQQLRVQYAKQSKDHQPSQLTVCMPQATYQRRASDDLLENIVNMHAAIDYGHPQGNKDNRQLLAEALNIWHKTEVITTENILLLGCNPYALLESALGRLQPFNLKQFAAERLCLKRSNRLVNILVPLLGADVKINKLVAALRDYVKYYPNTNIILDESELEKNIDAENAAERYSVFNRCLHDPLLKDRIILVRHAGGLYAPANEPIASILTFQPNLMATLLEASICMHGHAPRSLQYAYAHASYKLLTHTVLHDTDRPLYSLYLQQLRAYERLQVNSPAAASSTLTLNLNEAHRSCIPLHGVDRVQDCPLLQAAAQEIKKESEVFYSWQHFVPAFIRTITATAHILQPLPILPASVKHSAQRSVTM